MAEQEEQVEAVAQEDENDDNPDYKAPAPKSLDEILQQDKEDESLRKYKEQLLAEAGSGEVIIVDEKNPLNVIVKKLAISVDGREDVEIDLTLPKDKIKESKLVLKEGCRYRVKIFFNVQREIVPGLRYEQKVYRKGVRIDKGVHMVGSYGPKKDLHVYNTPYEDAPNGMLARGDYKVESRFTDDDKKIYLEWEWHLSIKKEFD
ncbi:rho GDP-dissociation inhibitor 1-like [Babylonia areolata]|uniref:rho GDP-dissociation inhibitor 1-like n=1 Tax=Babylonia areolata TaxID=304850 RepID=UPI003FD3E117